MPLAAANATSSSRPSTAEPPPVLLSAYQHRAG